MQREIQHQAANAARQLAFRPTITVVEQSVPVPRKGPDVPVYRINPKPGALRPAIVHTHGGGYVAGRATGSVPYAQDWAAELDGFVATVDYRLAPQTR